MDHDGQLTKGFLGCNYKESTLANDKCAMYNTILF